MIDNTKMREIYSTWNFYIENKEEVAYALSPDENEIVKIDKPFTTLKGKMFDTEGDVRDYLLREGRCFNASIRYEPYKQVSRVFLDENGHLCLNSFCPKKYKICKQLDMPLIYKPFFENLFPNEEEREWVYDWIAASFHQKSFCYLCLIGKGGIGKGVFAAEIMKRLHGISNWAKESTSWFSDNRDPELNKKTIFFLDEVNIKNADKTAKDKLKSLSETQMNLRFQRNDRATFDVFFNVIFASNELDSLSIDLDGSERRYGIPVLGTTQLRKIDFVKDNYGDNESLYVKELLDDKNIDSLRNFFETRWRLDPESVSTSANVAKQPKKMTEDLLYASLKDWHREMYSYFRENFGREIHWKEIQEKVIHANSFKASYATVRNAIKDIIIPILDHSNIKHDFKHDNDKGTLRIKVLPPSKSNENFNTAFDGEENKNKTGPSKENKKDFLEDISLEELVNLIEKKKSQKLSDMKKKGAIKI